MGRSQETFSKKEKEKKRLKKRRDKQEKREERKANSVIGGLDTMMAYLDEDGNITDTPPDPTKKKAKVNAENIVIGVPKKVNIPLDTERRGKIDFFNHDKGYGFILQVETNEKHFVHINGLIDQVVEGDKVSFELEKGLKGLNAVKVKKI